MPVLAAVPAPSSAIVMPPFEVAEDFVGVGGEEVALGAREVVLGQGGDLLEELGAGLVVEEPGGERFGRRGEAATCLCGDSFGSGRNFWCFQDGGKWRHVSLADLECFEIGCWRLREDVQVRGQI